MTTLLLLGLLAVLLVLRLSLVWVLIAGALFAHLVWGDGDLSYLVEDIWHAMDREELLAIPLFVLVGQIMARGQIASRLIEVIVQLSRPVPGGMAMATILSCAVFSAISGSSVVTMLAVGAVLYPALIANGYSARFAVGALCAGGTLGIVIPPSVPMILYGIVTESSIVDLFIAGVGPGLLLTGVFCIYAVVMNRHHRAQPIDIGALWLAARRGLPAMLMPVILLGGIYSGHFTPTEAAAVAIAYALLVEALLFRDMRLADYTGTVVEAAKLVGALFPLIAIAASVNLLLTEHHLPEQLVQWANAHVDSPSGFILAANALLLLIGCFMDTGSAIVVAAPLLQPLAESYGFSATHLGIVMILNLEIGILTPPFGLNLIVAMTAYKQSFGFITKAVLPWVGLMMACLLLIVFQPWIAMGLVQ